MRCRCGEEIRNCPEWLADVVNWICQKCAGAVPARPEPKEIKCAVCGLPKPREQFVVDLHDAVCHGKLHSTCAKCRRSCSRGQDVQRKLRALVKAGGLPAAAEIEVGQ